MAEDLDTQDGTVSAMIQHAHTMTIKSVEVSY